MAEKQTGERSSITNRFKTYHAANPWKSRLSLALITLVTLILIMRIMLAPSIIYGTTNWLKKSGIDSAIEDIDIDILHGTISLINASGIRDGKPLFNIGLIDIHWRWAPLSEKTIVVERVELSAIKIDIEQYRE